MHAAAVGLPEVGNKAVRLHEHFARRGGAIEPVPNKPLLVCWVGEPVPNKPAFGLLGGRACSVTVSFME